VDFTKADVFTKRRNFEKVSCIELAIGGVVLAAHRGEVTTPFLI
jgi:hypothetical protein